MPRQFFGKTGKTYRVLVEYQYVGYRHPHSGVIIGVQEIYGPYASQGGATQIYNAKKRDLENKEKTQTGFHLYTLERQIATGWKTV